MRTHKIGTYYPQVIDTRDELDSALKTWRTTRDLLTAAECAPALGGGDSSNTRRAVRCLENAQKAYHRACEQVALIVSERTGNRG